MIKPMNIILGGTHGLGWEIATQLREQGNETFVIGRSYDSETHGNGMRADMAERADMERVVAHIQNLGSTALAGFYWTVGIGYHGKFAEQQHAVDMLHVNLVHPLGIAQEAWRKMSTQDITSDMVVVSSTTGVRVRKDETTYATTKGGQVSFARNLASEAAHLKSPVRVTLFEPGGMKSPFWDTYPEKPANYENFMDYADVAAFMLDYLQQPDAASEKMVEKPEVDAWLTTRQ